MSLRYNRVLLLNASYKGSWFPPEMPAGLGYICELLKLNDIEYDVMDMDLGYGVEDLKEKMKSFDPDLLGISMFSIHYLTSYGYIKVAKEIKPNLNVITGGPHIANLKSRVLEQCKDIDYGVDMEGEDLVLELCKGRPIEEIKGLFYRGENGEVKFTGPRDAIIDLDSLPTPTFEKFEIDKYVGRFRPDGTLGLVSSRGCPYKCTFCSVPVVSGKKFRIQSPEKVADEVEYWYERGYNRINWRDDNFTLRKDRVYEICDAIEKRSMKGLMLSCNNGVRADRTDRDLLKRMRDIGFYRLAYGVETGDDTILKLIKKGETREEIEQGIKNATELGYDIELFFLIGSPKETYEDIQRSFNLCLKYPVAQVAFYHIIPYPNTEMYNWVEREGYFLYPVEEYLNDVTKTNKSNTPVFETPELSVPQRQKAWLESLKIQDKVFRRRKKVVYAHWGILGNLIAMGYGNRFIREKIFDNSHFRGLVIEPIKALIKPIRTKRRERLEEKRRSGALKQAA